MANEKGILKDFPILAERVDDKKLVYLDNAATTQKPREVIDAIKNYYEKYNANPHRGTHKLSVSSTEIYENTREQVRTFINASSPAEIIFTKNTTESINLVAYSYAMQNLKKGDEIVIAISEHHSNLVPWQVAAKKTGAVLKYMYVNQEGRLEDEEIEKNITNNTKIVAIAHITNTLGVIHPIEKVINKAHSVGAVVVVDGAQSVPHIKEDVQKLDVDFLAFSGHKMLAPMGVGVLYGKKELLEKMEPFMYGGDMIEYVEEQETSYAELPFKFEAGTQNVEAVFGLSKAIEYIEKVGYEYIQKVEKELTEYALEKLLEMPDIIVYGPKNMRDRIGVISFNVKDVHPHDTATILDKDGVAIRSGHHCAEPFLKYMGYGPTCRLSIYLYNTKEDIDIFIESLKSVRGWLGFGS